MMAGSETIKRNFLLGSTSFAKRFAAACSRLGGSLVGLSAVAAATFAMRNGRLALTAAH